MTDGATDGGTNEELDRTGGRTYLLAGGGTAGHVNPLLAVADALREREPDAEVLVLGTREGLEARLVPLRGYELLIVDKVPFPRRPNRDAAAFPNRFRRAIAQVRRQVKERRVDVVVGFGGYASAPAYVAARREGIPFVVHEANARPGLANVLGARRAAGVGVAFEGTPLTRGRVVGMPLRREIVALDRDAHRAEAGAHFGLDAGRPTLLVFGGSLGAQRLNDAFGGAWQDVLDAGWQLLHVTGEKSQLADPGVEGYSLQRYVDRMDLAFSLADFIVSRAGAATVSEISALGIPAAYVPYAVGNGEQALNAGSAVRAGAAILIPDAEFTPDRVRSEVVPLLADAARRERMARAAASVGTRSGTENVVAMIDEALGR
ncbi:UDP-N-acetylglucosamine--N-acetylmuramyl-(pentapeptide) pyrophosphoryl-undecaprenol N-acetylglucosamine transferase [Microbacterium sp. 4R-513]|uniref:UDP-N-acetylglucosamine--N-acetylmuramyl- (pentapeptide) pyrophosphoryl-undecaprenol N-acetylglucosamine transferase n=1 Tax=Microbacterium sp. 4R-513 TaxID=2567934 RepID=UPI0013E11C58|nr:UDP-N-acetylglucosamine--N-acetylmuramyl-(pentapeptide) pyrophosphoryl-undecaprenol N-acetylglucosamine transferase [Microbacterium sp. 4R-513]QIG40897.1 UDP-N-acetylglucosamine--N-acetylmuramyl-(pentapeptide) pyrophosphoryl-undecaprenol N-acetylglucosamine transferase [Microbacterium sp. 4R-513]